MDFGRYLATRPPQLLTKRPLLPGWAPHSCFQTLFKCPPDWETEVSVPENTRTQINGDPKGLIAPSKNFSCLIGCLPTHRKTDTPVHTSGGSHPLVLGSSSPSLATSLTSHCGPREMQQTCRLRAPQRKKNLFNWGVCLQSSEARNCDQRDQSSPGLQPRSLVCLEGFGCAGGHRSGVQLLPGTVGTGQG